MITRFSLLAVFNEKLPLMAGGTQLYMWKKSLLFLNTCSHIRKGLHPDFFQNKPPRRKEWTAICYSYSWCHINEALWTGKKEELENVGHICWQLIARNTGFGSCKSIPKCRFRDKCCRAHPRERENCSSDFQGEPFGVSTWTRSVFFLAKMPVDTGKEEEKGEREFSLHCQEATKFSKGCP